MYSETQMGLSGMCVSEELPQGEQELGDSGQIFQAKVACNSFYHFIKEGS